MKSNALMSSGPRDDEGRPPGGGRWDHETMREAAQRSISGDENVDMLAASGGLALPGHRAHESETAGPVAEEPIPGERDRSTMMPRQPGAIGGRCTGADTPPVEPAHVMDEATMRDRRLEGGGGE